MNWVTWARYGELLYGIQFGSRDGRNDGVIGITTTTSTDIVVTESVVARMVTSSVRRYRGDGTSGC